MSVRLESKVSENFDWKVLSRLFEKVGWGLRCLKKLERAFSRSSNVRIAFLDDGLVGCARSIDDGEWYSLLVDVIVDPDHQMSEVGRAVIPPSIMGGLPNF